VRDAYGPDFFERLVIYPDYLVAKIIRRWKTTVLILIGETP
jgi:hypothetical protein